MLEATDQEVETLIPPSRVPIYETGTVPSLEGFEEMPGYAFGAYVGGFSRRLAEDKARCDAVQMTAANFKVGIDVVLRNYQICIIPGLGFHGRIFAKRKI